MKGMNSVRHMKKLLALVLSIVLCLSLLTLTAGAKDLGVGAVATLDTDKLSVSDAAQTVALTIAMRGDIITDGIGGELYCPDGWTLTGISSSLPGFNASCYNLSEKVFGWHTPDAENMTVKEILTAVFTIPANTAANTYELGVKELQITSDYGKTYDDAKELTASATLTISQIAVTSISLNKSEITLPVGKSETLTATVAPENATNKNVTWTSSNTAVATVENGVVTAVGKGTATITASSASDPAVTDTCEVTVTNPVTGITLTPGKLALTVGEKQTLTATVEPAGADDSTVVWTSGDAKVATVDQNGKVTAVGAGTTTITATAGGKSATCDVTVSTKPVPIKGIALSDAAVSVGRSIQLEPVFTPADTTERDVTWASSDRTVATVDANGRVSGVAEGKVTITVTSTADPTITASCTVTVTRNYLDDIIAAADDDTLPFNDVSSRDYYYDAVEWAVEQGITSGTSRHTFSPDAACTRAQVVTFLWRAAGCPQPSSRSNPFTDVHANDYFYDAVLWAVENGITNGTSATTFSPNATVTRAQVVTFLWRANGQPAASGSSFKDVTADKYYAAAVAWAVSQRITTGTGYDTFSPDAACTRAQIVTFLYRAR